MGRQVRAVLAAVVAVAGLAGLSGCGDSGSPQKEAGMGEGSTGTGVAAADGRADAAIDDDLHAVASAVGLTFNEGTRSYAICGETYAPGGVVLQAFLNFEVGPPGRGVDEAKDLVATTLEGQGWSVERPRNPAMLVGTKDDVELQFEIGARRVVVTLRSDCVETSDDEALRLQDEKPVDVVWRP